MFNLFFVGNAISCYDCNSATDKRCVGEDKVPLPEDLKKNCPVRSEKPYTLCRKINQVIDFEVNGRKDFIYLEILFK